MKFHFRAKSQAQAFLFFQAAVAAFVFLTCLTPHLLAERTGSSASNSTAPNFTATRSAGAYQIALDSITAETLKEHVYFLADDKLQGRKPGTEGGRAAGRHIAEEFKKYGLAPGDLAPDDLASGDDDNDDAAGDYFQTFTTRYRNVLAILPGSDPELKHEVVILGAHYDHVGYGAEHNSYGPFGQIHNGADDNASGTSGLLELAEAFKMLPKAPRRSILFVFWDAEELGMFGSKHWGDHPTVPLDRVAAMINLDMIGRMEGDCVMALGTDSSPALAKMVKTVGKQHELKLMLLPGQRACSDHASFHSHGIPAVHFFTIGGIWDTHKPTDVAEKLNYEGIHRIVLATADLAVALAEVEEPAEFVTGDLRSELLRGAVRLFGQAINGLGGEKRKPADKETGPKEKEATKSRNAAAAPGKPDR